MRTLRMSIVGMAIVGLLASPSVAVVAEAEEEHETPSATYVTGEEAGAGNFEPSREWEESGILRQQVGIEREMEWSDPRLPSRMLERAIFDERLAVHPQVPVETSVWMLDYRLEGPDGTWTGTGRQMTWRQLERSEGPGMRVTIMLDLTGEGAYAGLTARLIREGHMYLVDDEVEGVIGPFEGFIFEGPLPPFPNPVEASVE